jgi:2,3-dihydroxybenzoate-AMP ligase
MSKMSSLSGIARPTRADDTGLVPYSERDRDEYRSTGYWGGMSLPAELVRAAEQHNAGTALVTGERRWSFRELFDAAHAFAAGLPRLTSLRSGDAVMFQSGNVDETVVAYLGCLLAGIRPVCTLPQHGVREIGVLARHVGARGLIVQADFGRGLLPANAQTLLGEQAVREVVVARGPVFPGAVGFDAVLAEGSGIDRPLPYESLGCDGVAVFQLSGGTTGLPKIAPRQHEEYAYNARAWAEALEWRPGDVVLYPLPIMHNAGISVALQPALLSGATLVLAPSADIDTVIDLIEAERPRSIPLVPPALAIRLLDSPRAATADLSSIEDFIVGGQKLPVEIAERLRDELGIALRQKFGMAEGMFLVTPREASERVRHHTVGAPISPGDEIRILRPDTEDEAADGELGELCVRGPYTIRGYYRAAPHNLAAFTADGFYRTGDLARRHLVDGAAYYSIDGRIKDVINRGVEKIHAEEVEELLMRHPAIANAALVAMPDRVLGERACAYLLIEPGAEAPTVASLATFLTGLGLARYKLPERVETAREFPLSKVGKVSKKALREDIERKMAAGERG